MQLVTPICVRIVVGVFSTSGFCAIVCLSKMVRAGLFSPTRDSRFAPCRLFPEDPVGVGGITYEPSPESWGRAVYGGLPGEPSFQAFEPNFLRRFFFLFSAHFVQSLLKRLSPRSSPQFTQRPRRKRITLYFFRRSIDSVPASILGSTCFMYVIYARLRELSSTKVPYNENKSHAQVT
jgi:hypothetical protein